MGPLVLRSVQTDYADSRAGIQEGGHLALCAHTGNARGQWRADFAGIDDCEGNGGQRGDRSSHCQSSRQCEGGRSDCPGVESVAGIPGDGRGHGRCGRADRRIAGMLMKIADNCDEDVDNAASAMTSLLEPIMIVFLAVVVGSIVIAMFWPLVIIID